MSVAITNSHRIGRIWAPPSEPPRPLRPHGTPSVWIGVQAWATSWGGTVETLGSSALCVEAGSKLGMSCIGSIVVPSYICGFDTRVLAGFSGASM